MAKEYIERDALIELANYHVDGAIDAYDIALFPAADVVEVVRCGECRSWCPCSSGKAGTCKGKVRGVTKPGDFCSCGERRDNDAD